MMRTETRFETARPEAEGITPGAIREFFQYLEMKGLPMHGVVVARHGKLLAEGYWKPFDRDFMHRMYSTSKSFAAVAIGILEGEGRVSLDDPLIRYFPEYENANVHPYVRRTTVRDALSMRLPFILCDYVPYENWADAFFLSPADHPPGMVFRYDTIASVMLALLVHRITGEEMTAYLRPRLFEPAGMREDIWSIQTRCGHDWAGSGVMCTTRDLARFGQVCMQDGIFEGRQLIPRDFIRTATGKVSDNVVASPWPESCFGYGYQFWRTRHGFACCGMGSQVAVCVPAYDLVVATTADTQSLAGANADIFNAVWEKLLPALSGAPLPPDDGAYAELTAYLDDLELKPVAGEKSVPVAETINGKTYILHENPMHMRWIRFEFAADEGQMHYENATGAHTLRFGLGRQVRQPFPETHYYGKRMMQPSGTGYDSHTSAAWVDGQTLLLCCYATDWYMGTLKMSFAFSRNEICIHAQRYAEMFFDEYQGFACGETGDI